MKINIAYNKEDDEFTNDLSLESRLKKYIINHFPIAYTISALAPIYLLGGGIRDLIQAKHPKDLDFVVLGNENLDWILRVFDAYNISYTINRLGGFKFNYNGTEIDLWTTNDLLSAIQWSIDGLFFCLENNSLISLTFDDFIKNGLKLVNNENNIENGREKKLEAFSKTFRC